MLKERCFITINENNVLSMHNLLSGMGREIARHSRLFATEDICDVLENNKGTEAIEGMVDMGYRDYGDHWEDESDDSYSVDAEIFNRMPNLRFLMLHYCVNMRGSFGVKFKDLRWLSWEGCDSLPSKFCADKLGILELRYNTISRFSKKAMVLRNLKILDMSYSYQLSRTPDFNLMKCLETLNLSYCSSLVEVDISIGNLVRLATLGLTFCGSLRSLPESICRIESTEKSISYTLLESESVA